ncbi:MAG: phage holin family protein [Corynebacterium sp.]|nr:phage holin family protein [Corynebacterium sp.]
MVKRIAQLALRIAAIAVALWCAVSFVPGINLAMPSTTLIGHGTYDKYAVFFLAGAVIFAVQAIVGPVVKALSLPITLLTLGLFLLVINAALLYLASAVATYLGLGLTVDTFGAAVIGSIIISIGTMIGNSFTK